MMFQFSDEETEVQRYHSLIVYLLFWKDRGCWSPGKQSGLVLDMAEGKGVHTISLPNKDTAGYM